MGRAKIISTEEKTIKNIITACSIKFVIPIDTNNEIGEYIKMDRKDGEIVLHFTKKNSNPGLFTKDGITISFD